jgi:hypothetical protein
MKTQKTIDEFRKWDALERAHPPRPAPEVPKHERCSQCGDLLSAHRREVKHGALVETMPGQWSRQPTFIVYICSKREKP